MLHRNTVFLFSTHVQRTFSGRPFLFSHNEGKNNHQKDDTKKERHLTHDVAVPFHVEMKMTERTVAVFSMTERQRHLNVLFEKDALLTEAFY